LLKTFFDAVNKQKSISEEAEAEAEAGINKPPLKINSVALLCSTNSPRKMEVALHLK
jgi:hypothetical protein